MASAAVRPEYAVMDIVGAMAIATAAIRRFDPGERPAVTFLAGDACVRSFQRKLRLHVMVEKPGIPGNGVVAGFAAIMEFAVVRIIIPVA